MSNVYMYNYWRYLINNYESALKSYQFALERLNLITVDELKSVGEDIMYQHPDTNVHALVEAAQKVADWQGELHHAYNRAHLSKAEPFLMGNTGHYDDTLTLTINDQNQWIIRHESWDEFNNCEETVYPTYEAARAAFYEGVDPVANPLPQVALEEVQKWHWYGSDPMPGEETKNLYHHYGLYAWIRVAKAEKPWSSEPRKVVDWGME